MSAAALYVLLIPAIGYICLYKKNSLKIKTKPVSGLELTYHSAIYGAIFLVLSCCLVRTFSYFTNCSFSDQAKPFLPYLFNEIDSQIIYFIFAAILSWIYSLVGIKIDKTIWHGDSNLGRIWGELLAKETIIVIFLKSGKCYQGQLIEVEVSERVALEERLLTLFVILSGFRDEKGVVEWNTSYQQPLRHHFTLSEIINFTEYASGATFKITKKK